jgi:hypothetical protein
VSVGGGGEGLLPLQDRATRREEEGTRGDRTNNTSHTHLIAQTRTHLDEGRHDVGARALVEQRLALLLPQVEEALREEDELDGGEEVGLARACVSFSVHART